MSVVVEHPHVEVTTRAYVRGLTLPVARLWVWYRRGVAIETLFKRYPHLKHAVILDALSFAYDNIEMIEAEVARDKEAGHW